MTREDASRPPLVRRRVVISGQVQGVFFRESCRQQARARGVAGSVRNLEDGTVEAVFEGLPAAVDRLVEWCRTGPPHAVVESVATFDSEPIGESTFQVR
jgi:acylphosphatase